MAMVAWKANLLPSAMIVLYLAARVENSASAVCMLQLNLLTQAGLAQ
jgi:hypothetical protein